MVNFNKNKYNVQYVPFINQFMTLAIINSNKEHNLSDKNGFF